jgi:hypothetical protein
MKVMIKPNGGLQIDHARITHKNFEGRESDYNEAGKRNFSLIIAGGTIDDGISVREVDRDEMAEILQSQVNEYGDGWNIKIKPARTPEEEPFVYLPVKITTKRSVPPVFINSAGNVVRLEEDALKNIDYISIRHVNLDIRPYDDQMRGRSFRVAYLDSMEVIQEIDRFTARYAEEEHPEE